MACHNNRARDSQVRFESGEGIQVNKTEVVYKGTDRGYGAKAMSLDDEGSNRGVICYHRNEQRR